MLVLHLCNYIRNGIAIFYCTEYLFSAENCPIGCDNGSVVVLFSYESDTISNLLLCCCRCMTKYDTISFFNLVIKKLTKVFHIHFTFVDVCHCCESVEHNVFTEHTFSSFDNIGELPYARRLNDNSIGMIRIYCLFKSFRKISYQATAYATGIHLGNTNTGFL